MVVSEPAVKLPRDADMKAPPGIVGRSRNLVLDWVCRWVFSFVRMAPSAVEHLRSLAAEGSVVYVMRQRSWVDYLLVTCVLMRERLPTPEFANGISPLWFRPWREVFATQLPARATVVTGLVAPDGLVEIMVTAARP